MNEEPAQPAKIDVMAERQLFTPSLDKDDQQINVAINAASSTALPASILYEPTNVLIGDTPQAQVAQVSMDLKVKFDPELEVKNLSEAVDSLSKGLGEAVQSIRSRWIPDPKAASDFEERPTLEQTNLIFEARKEQFSSYPKWA